MNQTTLTKAIRFSGIGLHSAQLVSCTVRPASEDTGIIFHVKNGSKKACIIPSPKSVSSTGLATTLSSNSIHVSTVEHLLAALRGLAIDNAHIDIDGTEIPILDGSAKAYVDKITQAGIKVQNAPRKVFKATKPFQISDGQRLIRVEPFDGFQLECLIDFPHPAIGRQKKNFSLNRESFSQIADARTFCFLKDVEAMHAAGLARGGSLDNAIVIDDEILNQEGLRYKDEFVRHKILDFIGDMAVFSLPLMGKFTVHCSGHEMNNIFARELEKSGSLRVSTLQPKKKFSSKNFVQPLSSVISPRLAAS